jgi:glycosyl transferase family 25
VDDIPIYIINLDRSPGRLAHARRELDAQQLTFNRIPAVDARNLDDAALVGVFDAALSRRSYYAPLHRGEIACFLSHRLAWETFLATSEAPFAVIFEDDFALQGELAPVVAALTSAPTLGWDMIKLWSRRRGRIASAIPLDAAHRLVRHRIPPSGTVGQIVTRAAAGKLLANTLPIRRPLDVQLQHWWEMDLNILSVDPRLVTEASGSIGGSDLTRSSPASVAGKLEREILRPLYRLMLAAKSVYYSRLRRP